MKRVINKWYSPNLNKEMEVVTYGEYGFALLLFPTAAADYLEYERFLLIDAIKPMIEAGKCKVFSINSINSEAWLNNKIPPHQKSERQEQYNKYIVEEVVPFIHTSCNGLVPIIASGASLGAFHSANAFFRRPDIFSGVIGMSGSYDLEDYSKGHFDDTVYFNSPVHYLSNMTDNHTLNQLRDNKKILIMTGQGNYENPTASKNLSQVLNSKNIPHQLDVWGHDMPHDWPTWRDMLPYALSEKF